MKKQPKMTMLKVWMQIASHKEQAALAKAVKTSRQMLYHYSNGTRKPSAERAGGLARASIALHTKNPGLPVLYRTDLADACANCDYARSCLGPIAIRGEFPITSTKGKT